MKKNALKNHLMSIFCGIGMVMVPVTASAQTSNVTDECSKELLLSYFPEAFVGQTLKKYNIPQDKWDSISKGLAAKDKDVLKIVEDKASKLNPNPFKDRDPAQRQIAVKIFRETLTQVFSEVMNANGVTDDRQIAAMLDDIQQQKAKNFAQCMEKQKQNFQMQRQQNPSTNGSTQGAPMTPKADDSAQPAQTEQAPQLADNDDSKSSNDDNDDDHNEEGRG